MSIKVKKVRTFEREIALGDIGIDGTIKVHFKALQRGDLEALTKQELTDRQFCERIIDSVDGVGDDDGAWPAAQQKAYVIEDVEICRKVLDEFNSKYTAEKRGN